jgi:hypothetical protein
MRSLLFAALAAIALMTTANAEDDPDALRYPAPKLHPQNTGCVTIHGKSTIGDSPYISRICVGDTASPDFSHCSGIMAGFLRCWLLIFVRARGLVAARAAEFLDIVIIDHRTNTEHNAEWRKSRTNNLR